jgi:hypothetical protein
MVRHKRITAWTKQLAHDVGWELVKKLYDGEDECKYGTLYNYSQKTKASPGTLFYVTEGKDKGMAIATNRGIANTHYYTNSAGRRRVYKKQVFRTMLWLNEEGERLVRNAMLKALV